MGKTSGDRHFALFAFAVYGLTMFPKALEYVFVPSTRPIEKFLEGEWPPNQSIEEWVQNLSTLTYQEIEWRAPWMIRSTVLIGCGGHLWVPLLGIWGIISYSSLMVLSQYGCDQYVPTTASLNNVEALRLEANLSLRANELQKVRQQERIWMRVSNEKIAEMEVLEGEIFHLKKELKTKEEQNKEVTEEYTKLADCFIVVEQIAQAEDICEQIEELKKETTPFATRNEPALKLLEVAQAHYQNFIKLMRRKRKNDKIAHWYKSRSKANKMTKEELARMAKLEENMMEIMTTMVKGKAKVGEGSDTLYNPIPLYGNTRVYREDLSLQVPSVTIQIPRVNKLSASEEPRESWLWMKKLINSA
ncbi:hypothetical protein GOBAR_DD22116 [Gossypium barbadense]|nr:hypothetical protein GOBAR_DD22116 [Gossypium barbadense]